MSRVVHIIDYGIGNLLSVARAVEKAGGEARLTRDAAEIAGADRLLLPGVGAFEACMTKLAEFQLVEPVKAFGAGGQPFLGICVGMQMLMDHSLEFGRHDGLGIVPGHVAAIPTEGRKVPHIGWSALNLPPTRRGWQATILGDAEPGVSSAYFLHSFACIPADDADRLADADYAGHRICAAIQRGNVIGFQCHPEKSGPTGLRILERFLTL
ncbi:MAG: imidazole glycerol phosphate synthase subunit HisH [Sandarakinorhabdus sp.]|nr:imidazole glycerol phosphate synthase subunit HisH [Sandarakinorhabdus sp.]